MPTTHSTTAVTQLHDGVYWMQHPTGVYLEHDAGMVGITDTIQGSWFITQPDPEERVVRITCSRRDPHAVAPSALLQGY